MIPILPILMANKTLVKVVILAVFIAATYSCGYIHRGWKEDAAKREEAERAMERQQELEIERYAAEKQLESQLDAMVDSAMKLNEEVDDEIRNPINIDCKFSANWVRLINAAARSKPTI